MKTVFRFLFILLPMSLALADSAKLDFNGHSYQRFDTVMDWTAAKTFCEAKGAHLATITTSAEHDFVTANFLSRYVWLGGSDAAAEGTWTWITGETWSYSNWGSGEPNNGNGRGEHYLSTTPLDGGIKWNDLDNSPGAVVPLCEWDSQVVVAPSACGAAVSGVTFSDSFPGTSLDASKWVTTGEQTGGTIAVTPGKAQFNVSGDILFAQTVNNPIPTTGDFSIYCKGTIYAANSSHAALCQAQVASWPVAAAPYDPGTYWGVWGRYADQGNTLVVSTGTPGNLFWEDRFAAGINSTHEYEICFRGSEVERFRDGVSLGKRTLPTGWVRPQYIAMGNPNSPGPTWTSFETNAIEVRTLSPFTLDAYLLMLPGKQIKGDLIPLAFTKNPVNPTGIDIPGTVNLTCTSSNPSVLSVEGSHTYLAGLITLNVTGSAVRANAVGSATLTCGSQSKMVQVIQPTITAIEPNNLFLGEPTEFTVTGTDLTDNMYFSVRHCSSGAAKPNDGSADNQSFAALEVGTGIDKSSTRRVFRCTPDKPASFSDPFTLRYPGSSTNLVPPGLFPYDLQLPPATCSYPAEGFARVRKVYGVSGGVGAHYGNIPWSVMTYDKLKQATAMLHDPNPLTGALPVCRGMDDDLMASQRQELRLANAAADAALATLPDPNFCYEALGGDFCWGGYFRTFSNMDGEAFSKWGTAVVLNGAIALVDAYTIGRGGAVLKTVKRSKSAWRTFKVMKGIGTNSAKISKAIETYKKFSKVATYAKMLTDIGFSAYDLNKANAEGKLTQKDIDDLSDASVELYISGVTDTNLVSRWLNSGGSFLGENFGDMAKLGYALLAEGLRHGLMPELLWVAGDGVAGMVPVLGGVKDMWQETTAALSKPKDKFFANVNIAIQTSKDESQNVLTRHLASSLARKDDRAMESQSGLLEVSVTTLSFVNTPLGQTATRTVTLSNKSAYPVTIKELKLQDSQDSFELLNGCSLLDPIVPNASCDLTVRFAPLHKLSQIDTVEVDYVLNGLPFRHLISLYGNGGTAQTINLEPAPSIKVGQTGTVTATASSGLPVSFSITPNNGVCSLAGAVVTGISQGICTVYADQAGDATYLPAAQGTIAFSILSANLTQPTPPTITSITPGAGKATINFTPPTNTGGAPISSYTASCSATGQTTKTATGTGSPITVSGLKSGASYSCSLTASNGTYSSAASAATTVDVPKGVDITPILMLLLD